MVAGVEGPHSGANCITLFCGVQFEVYMICICTYLVPTGLFGTAVSVKVALLPLNRDCSAQLFLWCCWRPWPLTSTAWITQSCSSQPCLEVMCSHQPVFLSDAMPSLSCSYSTTYAAVNLCRQFGNTLYSKCHLTSVFWQGICVRCMHVGIAQLSAGTTCTVILRHVC